MKGGGDLIKGLKIGFLFTGTVIGAGFVSGKEIIVFFGKSGRFFPFICFLSVGLFFLTGLLFMTRAKADNLLTLSDVTKNIFKKGHKLFDLFIILCQIIVFSAMLAGIDSLFAEILGINPKIPLFSVFSLILGCVAVSFGIKGLLDINLVLVPVMILFIFLIISLKPDVNAEALAKDILTQNSFLSSGLLCVTYIGMNMLLAMNVLTAPAVKAEKKHIYIGIASGSLFIGILMFVIGTSLFNGPFQIINSDMPLLTLTDGMPGIFRLLCLIVIWSGIFTTMICSMFQITEYTKLKVKKQPINIAAVSLVGFALSRIGFSYIVEFLFPAMGVVGIIMIAAFWITRKKRYKQAKVISENEAGQI